MATLVLPQIGIRQQKHREACINWYAKNLEENRKSQIENRIKNNLKVRLSTINKYQIDIGSVNPEYSISNIII